MCIGNLPPHHLLQLQTLAANAQLAQQQAHQAHQAAQTQLQADQQQLPQTSSSTPSEPSSASSSTSQTPSQSQQHSPSHSPPQQAHSHTNSADRNSASDLLLSSIPTNSSISTAGNSTLIPQTSSTLSLTSSAIIPIGKKIDPVTHLWQFFRLGSSLCALFNALLPKEPLDVVITNDVKRCKRSVYDFVQGCKSELDYSDDELFTISNVFSDNTTDLLKVIRTVKLLLDTLESRNLITPSKNKKSSISSLRPPKDKRDKVVEEILMTERKFVQDLEVLHEYQCKLQDSGLLSADTIHNLFPSLNVLIDFQRRFLIGIEYHAHLPPEEQRFGSVFLNFQEGFEVYEGFALHHKKACEIAVSEAVKLQTLKNILDPSYELPSFLIKPIQRICKYPLLLEQLIKYTPNDYPNFQEQVDALHAIRRVTFSVNETKRRVENQDIVRDLSDRLVDWKGHNVEDFGSLIHDGSFPVLKAGTEREYHLYLFENIILCCKEASPSKKSMALTTKKNKPKRTSVLVLKGRIYVAYITNVSAFVSNGYLLHIAWGRDDATDTGFFDVRFKREEQLEQWRTAIESLVSQYNEEPSAIVGLPPNSAAAQAARTAAGYSSIQGAAANGFLPTSSLQQQQLQHLHQQQMQQQMQAQAQAQQQQQFGPGYNNVFGARHQSFSSEVNGTSYDDDDDDDLYMTTTASERYPNGQDQGARQYDEDTLAALHQGLNPLSYPVDQGQQLSEDLANSHISETPSAGNSNSNSSTNLRQATRQDSTVSLSALHPAHHFQSLRNRSASIPTNQLGGNNVGGAAAASSSETNPMTEASDGSSSTATTPNGRAHSHSIDSTGSAPLTSAAYLRNSQDGESGTLRNGNNEARRTSAGGPADVLGRVRTDSASSTSGSIPSSGSSSGLAQAAAGLAYAGGSAAAGVTSSVVSTTSSTVTVVAGTSPSRSSFANGSGSPGAAPVANGAPPAVAAAAAAASAAPRMSGAPTGKLPQMKVKLHYLDDTFLLIVPFNVTYTQLLERVERKIRLCGKQTPNPLRIKYKDEDDDFVTMRSDEDIQMAMEPRQNEDDAEDAAGPAAGNKLGRMGGNRQDLLTIWAA